MIPLALENLIYQSSLGDFEREQYHDPRHTYERVRDRFDPEHVYPPGEIRRIVDQANRANVTARFLENSDPDRAASKRDHTIDDRCGPGFCYQVVVKMVDGNMNEIQTAVTIQSANPMTPNDIRRQAEQMVRDLPRARQTPSAEGFDTATATILETYIIAAGRGR